MPLLAAAFFGYSLWTGGGRRYTTPPVEQVVETRVEEPAAKQNFDNTDIGLDPDKPLNYNLERIDDVSVPGKVIAEAKVGFDGAAEGPPQTVPPPPGFGGGQGGGVESDAPGAGAMFGESGGLLGGRALPGVAFAGRSAATRQKMLTEGGGNAASEAAVAKGLKWLVRTAEDRRPLGARRSRQPGRRSRDWPGPAAVPRRRSNSQAAAGEKESPYRQDRRVRDSTF